MLLACAYAGASPMLSFEFTNSGQVVGPTDDVTISARISNVGDPISGAFPSMLGIGPIPSQILGQYIDSGLPGIPFSLTLGTGESVEFDLVTYQPFPLGGSPGDPVATGLYTLPISTVTLQYTEIVFDPVFALIDSPVDTADASDFVWTVRDAAAAVPGPGTLALLGLGLTGFNLTRRKTAYRPV